MVAMVGLQGGLLLATSLASLGVAGAVCLWCRRRSKILQEENQLYDPQVIHRGGSMFAVTRSKTVTQTNQITSRYDVPATNGRPGASQHMRIWYPAHNKRPQEAIDNYEDGYQNVSKPADVFEPTYVDPIPSSTYGNVHQSDQDPYENVFSNRRRSDESDYENAEYLAKKENDDSDEPDYVNASTEN